LKVIDEESITIGEKRVGMMTRMKRTMSRDWKEGMKS
jgi:hypothetical protein